MRKLQGKINNAKLARSYRRKLSIRKKINGLSDRPRVSVTKGNKNLYVQVIDDVNGTTLFSSQTFGKSKIGNGADVSSAKLIGADLAAKFKSQKLDKAVFDRNGLKYCGIVEAIASTMRENGIRL